MESLRRDFFARVSWSFTCSGSVVFLSSAELSRGLTRARLVTLSGFVFATELFVGDRYVYLFSSQPGAGEPFLTVSPDAGEVFSSAGVTSDGVALGEWTGDAMLTVRHARIEELEVIEAALVRLLPLALESVEGSQTGAAFAFSGETRMISLERKE